MGKLCNLVCYLIGPIDRASDDGISWRRELREKCDILDIKFLDPTDKPKHIGPETGVEKHEVKRLMTEHKFAEAKAIVAELRHYDLRMVDTANFVIALIDVDVHMCGSYDEMFTAERQQKPVLVIMKQKKENLPAWLISFMKPEEIFESVDECVAYLKSLDDGTVPMDERWVDFKLDTIAK